MRQDDSSFIDSIGFVTLTSYVVAGASFSFTAARNLLARSVLARAACRGYFVRHPCRDRGVQP